jgi:hypothetical protein
VAITLLVTGCPHNEYTVDLQPHGNVIERTLTFFCVDGADTNNGTPNYQGFPTNELKAITALYLDGITNDGDRHIARGEFTNALPDDVGGVGAYTNVSTSLGNAAFYVERFRGNDDIGGITERHLKAADQLADFILGWSKSELGSEPGYDKLRQFLDVDFRRDLKNVGAYWWEGNLVENYRTNATEEFMVRFGQYLVERGYLQIGEIPVLYRDASDSYGEKLDLLLKRLVARHLGVPDSQPLPAFLAFLDNDDAISKSFGNYLVTTDAYRAKLQHWEEEKRTKTDQQKPAPMDVASEAAFALVDINLFGAPNDHLTVRLQLPLAPIHSNGRWDGTLKQVIWKTEIADRTNLARLPVFCYANWAEPSETFQTEHLGKVALTGDRLTEYCIWRSSLDQKQAGQWDSLLAGLQPGEHLTNTLNAFRFSGEPAQPATNAPSSAASPSVFARTLLIEALK